MSKILVIDAGTTGIRVLIYDEKCHILAQSYTEFPNYHPASDRVEQDGEEIWDAAQNMLDKALSLLSITMEEIDCIGITNQRATTVLWDRATGKPVTRIIVWQDTRTSAQAKKLMPIWGDLVYSNTGWPLSPGVYSSLNLQWIFDNFPELRQQAKQGKLAFGTIDSWLIYRLTGGKKHVISASNASVTGSYNLNKNEWYEEWLSALDIPLEVFPTVQDDFSDFGATDRNIVGGEVHITGAIADQHSALYAQGCIKPGMVKCTHGTGTFLDMLIGETPKIDINSGICCQIAWRKNGVTHYALEGYAGCTGAAIQWLRDGLGIINSSGESEALANNVTDNGDVYFVPALTGLSAPYWDPKARGTILGISPGTTRSHIVRAALEGIVYSIRDFIDSMQNISGYIVNIMAVDGGASQNDFLLQFQADQLDVAIIRPRNVEATSLGAALVAGLSAGIWKNEKEAFSIDRNKKSFTPNTNKETRQILYSKWKRAVDRSKDWSKE